LKAAEEALYDDLKGFLHEIDIMSKLRHPNILLLLGACLAYPDIAIIVEYISEGDVHDYLKREKRPWVQKLGMAVDAARGMAFLHLSNPPTLHQDLKSFNLLVESSGRVKVCDFGISQTIEDNFGISRGNGNSQANFGTLNWVAPEILDCQPQTTKSDVFSFGMVLLLFLIF